mgnify:CR=1 FL=1
MDLENAPIEPPAIKACEGAKVSVHAQRQQAIGGDAPPSAARLIGPDLRLFLHTEGQALALGLTIAVLRPALRMSENRKHKRKG